MGRYIDWDDVSNSYPDWAKTVSANTVGNLWIPRAEDYVDGRLAAAGYSVPFTPTPGLVRDLCIDVAYWKLAFASDKGKELGKILEDTFKAISDGDLVITNSSGPLGSSVRAWSSHQDYPTHFGVDSDTNWAVSSAWALDQQEARGQI
jgi:hypothetical protein